MRINIYEEELPDELDARAITGVVKYTIMGKKYFGLRLYLKSPDALHDTLDDDNRSAITIWGPQRKVATLLWAMAASIEPELVSRARGERGSGSSL